MTNQIPLPLETTVSYDRAQFLPSPSHAAALAHLAAPKTWPQGKLVIVGPTSSGKTHLAHICAQEAGVLVLRPGTSCPENAELAVVDDADHVAGDKSQEEWLFHLHNNILAKGGHLLMTARSAPARWGLALPDLASRMQATHIANIDAPDQPLLEALLVKQFSDRQVIPKPGVTAYLAKHMDRSFAAAALIVSRMETISRTEKLPATLNLAKRALADDLADDFDDNIAGQS